MTEKTVHVILIEYVLIEVCKDNEVERMRGGITLECTESKRRNYRTTKNKKNTTERLELMKYCKYLNKHTLHRETK